jgi:DNA-binding MarR family transcriptional regulator
VTTKLLLEEMKLTWKQRLPDADSSTSLTIVALARAANLIGRNLQKELDAFDLHISGFDVMATLYRVGRPEGLTLSSLANLMAVTPASITNRIDVLVSKGYVERVGSDIDRRVGYVRLTKSGSKLIEKILPLHFENEAKQLRGLKKGERKDLQKLLLKVLESLETEPEP